MITVLECHVFTFMLNNVFEIVDFRGQKKEWDSANINYPIFVLFILFVRNVCKSLFVFVVILIVFVFY